MRISGEGRRIWAKNGKNLPQPEQIYCIASKAGEGPRSGSRSPGIDGSEKDLGINVQSGVVRLLTVQPLDAGHLKENRRIFASSPSHLAAKLGRIALGLHILAKTKKAGRRLPPAPGTTLPELRQRNAIIGEGKSEARVPYATAGDALVLAVEGSGHG